MLEQLIVAKLHRRSLPNEVRKMIKQFLQAPTPTACLIKQLTFSRRSTTIYGDVLTVSGEGLGWHSQYSRRRVVCRYPALERHFCYIPEEGGEPDSIPLDRRRRRLQQILFSSDL